MPALSLRSQPRRDKVRWRVGPARRDKPAMRNTIKIFAAAALLAGALTSPASASGGKGGGGGGGGGTKPVLPAPAIAPGTFEGIGPGPVYIHDPSATPSAPATRRTARSSTPSTSPRSTASAPSSRTTGPRRGSARGPRGRSWKFSVATSVGPVRARPRRCRTRRARHPERSARARRRRGRQPTPVRGCLPFAAPNDSAYTVSAETVPFIGKTAIGFSNSAATNAELRDRRPGVAGARHLRPLSDPGRQHRHRHAGPSTPARPASPAPTSPARRAGTRWRSATTRSTTSPPRASTTASSSSVPYTAPPVRYVGVEGSLHAVVDNFTVRAGA